MQEFIEKLIARLEENIFVAELYGFGWDGQRVSNLLCLGDVKDISEQLAEEHKDNMEFAQKCVELAEKMNLCDLVAENVRLSHKIRFLEVGKNDFCEWKWGIDFAQVQCKGDRILFGSRRLFTYCPYCGKKIKIASYQPKGE